MSEPEVPSAVTEHAAQLVTSEIASSDPFRGALDRIRSADPVTLAQQIELTEVPAPPFQEEARGHRFAALLEESGATDVTSDSEGNVVGWVHGEARGTPVVVAAHLDTVFPEGTPVTVLQEGDRLHGPGISDNGRGLAALLAVVRCLSQGGIGLSRPLLLAGTVGEEGVGNLRGVRHLFSESGAAHRASAFISLDGAGDTRVVNRGVGSRRVRVRLTGPGGHSWADWGAPNPVHTLSTTIAELTVLPLPPGATLSVGRVSGGISVNAIPEEAWMEMEVRSVDEAALDRLEARSRATAGDAVQRANDRRREGTPPMALQWQSMGKRPAGTTSPSTPLVRAAAGATRELSGEPELVASSTDANVPMHLGIPAITLGAGGEAGLAHTIEEWYRNVRGPEGIARALLTLLVLDRMTRG